MKNPKLDLIRVATAVPKIVVGNPLENAKDIITLISDAKSKNVGILAFPEFSLTGASCESLFLQNELYKSQLEALRMILDSTSDSNMLIIIGGYFKFNSSFYDCAFIIKSGIIQSIIPKTFDNSCYFSNWAKEDLEFVDLEFSPSVTIGSSIIVNDSTNELNIGVVLGDDYLQPQNQASYLVANGAEIIVNLSAEKTLAGKAKHKAMLLSSESSKLNCAYLYASLGPGESTSNSLFSGDSYIIELGNIATSSQGNYSTKDIQFFDIDFGLIQNRRIKNKRKNSSSSNYDKPYIYDIGELDTIDFIADSFRSYSSSPFLPTSPTEQYDYCKDVFEIQANALAKRLSSTGLNKLILGISGGLDSTLALMVSARTMQLLNKPTSDIIALTMPGFGTTGQTYQNAVRMISYLGATFREIPIVNACLQHFNDIGHDPNHLDLAYENAQARERTQILMDIANMENALVVGTGDLSEIALGWATFNGDHISNYNVNAGIPKTTIPYVLRYVCTLPEFAPMAPILKSVTETPISPELLPPDPNGQISQKTEEHVGKYELHDFFIYHTLRNLTPPEKLYQIAIKTFGKEYGNEEIKRCLIIFYKRFFSQQFKRNCAPDSPQISEVFFSPKEFFMVGDICGAVWIAKAENLNTTL